MRHRETVFPFSTFDRVLSDCVLRPELPLDAEHGQDRWATTIDDVKTGFAFDLELDCDWAAIPRRTEWQLQDLTLAIRFRNEGVKTAKRIASWPADDVPNIHRFDGLQTGLEFQIDISLVTSRHAKRRAAPDVFAGTVVANRRFTFNTSGFRFPMEYANFDERGWPGDALWYIEFFDVESLEARADECVKVYVNEKVRNLFDARTRDKRASREAFTRMSGPLIFAEVARTALYRGLISEEASYGLAESIVATLTRQGGPLMADWIRLASEPSRPDEFTALVLSQLMTAESLRTL